MGPGGFSACRSPLASAKRSISDSFRVCQALGDLLPFDRARRLAGHVVDDRVDQRMALQDGHSPAVQLRCGVIDLEAGVAAWHVSDGDDAARGRGVAPRTTTGRTK